MKILDHRFKSGKPDGPDATQIQASQWNDGHTFTGGAHGSVLTRDTTDPLYGATWSPPPGIWAAVPYAAANFFTDSAATWAVASGSVNTHKYAIVGRVLRYHLWLGGAPSANTAQLRVKLPTGYLAQSLMGALVLVSAAGANEVAYVTTSPAQDFLSISKLAVGSTWTAGVVATVLVAVTIEV